jgi:hypothetical protein
MKRVELARASDTGAIAAFIARPTMEVKPTFTAALK